MSEDAETTSEPSGIAHSVPSDLVDANRYHAAIAGLRDSLSGNNPSDEERELLDLLWRGGGSDFLSLDGAADQATPNTESNSEHLRSLGRERLKHPPISSHPPNGLGCDDPPSITGGLNE